ncbi:hypothetical protein D9758_015910 [Tetrapyrgos nigripes]|uniref:Uncharacterized protein n=1 Tax=Tetrapyrgos nigripes TaxID=182062 RepID=A0A8H5FNC3_9AGAR|nr:hypothetical protein D9758_015910 [Tetrapyrgos nigripes]
MRPRCDLQCPVISGLQQFWSTFSVILCKQRRPSNPTDPIFSHMMSKDRNELARDILKTAFGVNDIKDIPELESVSEERLNRFRDDCECFGPNIPLARLDTSARTATAMRDLPWNQMLISRLAHKAIDLANDQPADHSSTKLKQYPFSQWKKDFALRVYKILLQIQKGRQLGLEEGVRLRYNAHKLYTRRKTARRKKFQRRQRLCIRMKQVSEQLNDEDGFEFWNDTLRLITSLTEDGMSDEEDAVEGEQRVKAVQRVESRLPAFDNVLEFVDNLQEDEPMVFHSAGRKRLRRVTAELLENADSVEQPPTHLIEADLSLQSETIRF